jgi:hypothetical protein
MADRWVLVLVLVPSAPIPSAGTTQKQQQSAISTQQAAT